MEWGEVVKLMIKYFIYFVLIVIGIYVVLFTGTSAVVRAWFTSKRDIFIKTKQGGEGGKEYDKKGRDKEASIK